MKLWPLAFLAPALVIGGAVWTFSHSRSSALPTEVYATRAEAESKNAFAKVPEGWLPDFIPSGATQIRAAHNTPTHQTWGEFQAPSPSWSPASADKAAPSEVLLPGAPPVVDWWPVFLRGGVASGDLQQQGYRIFFVETEASPLVVARRGTQVYFWRLARQ